MIRLGLQLLVLAGILFLPWWVSALSFFVLLAAADAPEVLLYGLLADILYGVPPGPFFDIPLIFTAYALVAYLASGAIKSRLAYYH